MQAIPKQREVASEFIKITNEPSDQASGFVIAFIRAFLDEL